MIGMMNGGSDSVEFYGAARQSSLYAERHKKDSRTYTPEGRVFINGNPVFQESPEDMWQSVIHKILTKRFIANAESKANSGPLQALRRLSSKLRPNQVKEMKNGNEMSAKSEIPSHVTVIRINSIDNSRLLKANPPPRPADAITAFDNSSILRRLLEERALLDEEKNEIIESDDVTPDSGRASFDESGEVVNSNVVVERF
ncbi:unnamed protein product [Auanema sp. JU1783]|nr:unnamed protein product [Auanema sp. JU1783]